MNTLLDHFNEAVKRIGKQCLLNNTSNIVAGIFKEIDDKFKSIDTKYFITATNLNQGDIITYNNVNYIVITKNNNINSVYSIYVVREAPYTVNFWVGDTLKNTPFYVDTKIFDTSSDKYMLLEDGQVYIYLQSNTSTNMINLNDRIIKFGDAWKVIAIDRTVSGILKLNCKIDGFITGDNAKDEIPEHTVTVHTYVVSVNPSTISSLNVGSTQQLTVSVTEDGNTLSNATFIYTSSDTTIATVSASGLITGIKAGSATITVTYTDSTNVEHTATVNSTITAPTPVGNLIINGNNSIKINATSTYTIQYDNGSPITNVYTWNLLLVSGTNAITIVSQTSTQVTLKGNSVGQALLKCLDGSGNVVASKGISVKNGF